MKLPIVAIVIFLLFGFSSGKPEKRLLGYWEIVKLEQGDKPSREEIPKKYIVFEEGGSMKGGKTGKEPNKSGYWELKNEDSVLYLKIEGGSKREDGDYQILELTKKHMKLKKDSMVIYLEKSKKSKLIADSKKD